MSQGFSSKKAHCLLPIAHCLARSAIPEEDWRVAHTRIEEKLRRNAQTQKGWTLMDSATLVDAAKLLCESDAASPTPEELRWLRDNLLEHQQAVEKLIKLIDSLLNR
ncbi:MAG: hypothetical protein RID53_13395 [Coleofasciculus sp. B1-GNL1-01]|uniref:hypothetical protein n=1 Tax=Coleofasciculus sp. B1-GNL1-01 TaxID=3068484 RepID=UPI0032F31FAA